jgi:hypothetical protein
VGVVEGEAVDDGSAPGREELAKGWKVGVGGVEERSNGLHKTILRYRKFVAGWWKRMSLPVMSTKHNPISAQLSRQLCHIVADPLNTIVPQRVQGCILLARQHLHQPPTIRDILGID